MIDSPVAVGDLLSYDDTHQRWKVRSIHHKSDGGFWYMLEAIGGLEDGACFSSDLGGVSWRIMPHNP